MTQHLLPESPLYGEGYEDWSGQSRHHRSKIRESITDTLADLTESDVEDITDLAYPPRPHLWCVSISHTLEGGGWMAVRRPLQVGWDIEMKDRIRLAVIERVCSKKEIHDAPLPALLWCAKEAYFKALEDEQPSTVVQIEISGWEALDKSTWTWQGVGPRNAKGVILEADRWFMAACLV
jgi:4'-phosphopantetheinyl transferase EntD